MANELKDFSKISDKNGNIVKNPKHRASLVVLTVGEIRERFREEYNKSIQDFANKNTFKRRVSIR